MNTTQQPRHRLSELISLLPKGGQRKIARRASCSYTTVSNVLNGKQTQNSPLAINIIRIAERLAGIN